MILNLGEDRVLAELGGEVVDALHTVVLHVQQLLLLDNVLHATEERRFPVRPPLVLRQTCYPLLPVAAASR
jgi:hypothetical protein